MHRMSGGYIGSVGRSDSSEYSGNGERSRGTEREEAAYFGIFMTALTSLPGIQSCANASEVQQGRPSVTEDVSLLTGPARIAFRPLSSKFAWKGEDISSRQIIATGKFIQSHFEKASVFDNLESESESFLHKTVSDMNHKRARAPCRISNLMKFP
ncbi:hypothetical protein BC629DRAFT_687786 [Irpex lacteus]|nr:hypothetical protein BC629DRAFT_687786 [Irpex lacteus]